jgi:hypothetical protein
MYHGQMLHYLTRDFEDVIPGDFKTFVTGNMTHEKPTDDETAFSFIFLIQLVS